MIAKVLEQNIHLKISGKSVHVKTLHSKFSEDPQKHRRLST